MTDYNPNSQDAILAKLLANSEAHTAATGRIEQALAVHRTEIDALKKDKHMARGAITGVALLAPAAWDFVKSKLGA